MKLSKKTATAAFIGSAMSMPWNIGSVFHSGKNKSSLSRFDRAKRKRTNKAARKARRINRLKAA